MKTINLKLTNDQIELLSNEMGGVSQGIKKILVYVQGQNKHIRNAIKLVGEAVLPGEDNINRGPAKDVIRHNIVPFIEDTIKNEVRLKLKRSEFYRLYLEFCTVCKIEKMGKKIFFEEMRNSGLCEEKRTNKGEWFFILFNPDNNEYYE